MISICNGWEFTPEWTDAFARGASKKPSGAAKRGSRVK